MKWILIAATLVLTGCYTPGEIVKAGTRFDLIGTKDPLFTAQCIERTAEETSSMTIVRLRPGGTPGSHEITVYNPNGTTYLAVITVTATSGGSAITAYISPMAFSAARMVDVYTKGCL